MSNLQENQNKIHFAFLARFYGFVLTKISDPNFTGVDLFYRVKDCWKLRDEPNSILIQPHVKGLSFKIGEWCFRVMIDAENHSESSVKPFFMTLKPDDLTFFVDDFLLALKSAELLQGNLFVEKLQNAIDLADELFDENEKEHWNYISKKGKKELRNNYKKLVLSEHQEIRKLERIYSHEISNRILHDRQICMFISSLMREIGFDREYLADLPKRWKSRHSWPASIKEIISARDRGKCANCGVDIRNELLAKAHHDHIIPLAKGGCNDIVNLQLLCENCNLKKGTTTLKVKSSIPDYSLGHMAKKAKH